MGDSQRPESSGGTERIDGRDASLAAALAVEQPHYVPGRIAAESFDDHGVRAADAGRRYEDDGVTLRRHGEDGVHVAWLKGGEWLAYDAEVDGAGAYELTVRVAAAPEYGGGSLQLECDGVDVGTVTIEPTGGWYDWETVTTRLGLAAGERRLTVLAEEGGWSLDWIDVSRPE